jgi:hypothetical protein
MSLSSGEEFTLEITLDSPLQSARIAKVESESVGRIRFSVRYRGEDVDVLKGV